MTLGEKIATLRRENKMTQRELAEIINVSDKVISKWETGRTLPDVEAIMILSKTFNVPISEIFECIENDDQEKSKKYDEERIWQYKKFSVIACTLLSLSQIFFWLSTVEWSRSAEIQDTISFVLIIFMINCLALSISLQLIQYMKLNAYCKGKHYQNEYKHVLKKYFTIYILVALFWILFFVTLMTIAWLILHL